MHFFFDDDVNPSQGGRAEAEVLIFLRPTAPWITSLVPLEGSQ
jgi:hypothetical protein